MNNERLGPEGMTENKMILISLGRAPRPGHVDESSTQIQIFGKEKQKTLNWRQKKI